MNGLRATASDVVPVRFSGVRTGLGLLPWVVVLGGFLLFFWPIPMLGGIVVAGFAVAALLLIAGSFDRRPLLVVEPEGVRLPCAGNVLLGYDEIEVWAEEYKSRNDRYWTFSLQRRPRLFLELSWWARLRFVRVNKLVEGDIVLDSRILSIHPRDLAALIQERIDRAAEAAA